MRYRDVGATGVSCSVWPASETQCLEVTALCQQFLETGSVRRELVQSSKSSYLNHSFFKFIIIYVDLGHLYNID